MEFSVFFCLHVYGDFGISILVTARPFDRVTVTGTKGVYQNEREKQ